MDPFQATELFRHMDFDAMRKPRNRPSHPRRQHLITRLRTWRRPPE